MDNQNLIKPHIANQNLSKPDIEDRELASEPAVNPDYIALLQAKAQKRSKRKTKRNARHRRINQYKRLSR